MGFEFRLEVLNCGVKLFQEVVVRCEAGVGESLGEFGLIGQCCEFGCEFGRYG